MTATAHQRNRRGAAMKQSIARFSAAFAILLLGAGTAQSAAPGDEESITAFATWVGQGGTFQTGAKDLTFVGTLVGTVYVETEKGPVASGRMICPAMVKVEEDASQRGTGSCAITAKDGAKIFADIACTGVFMVGCEGDFKLTGGTERFAGVTGSGPVLIRSELRTISVLSDVASKDQATGILYLRDLHYKLP
jgi:hypothetical protein